MGEWDSVGYGEATMSKLGRARWNAVFTCLVCIMLAVARASEAHWFGGFTDRVLREGHEAFLPPHLALVLGLGTGEKPVTVKQLATQNPQEARAFNVSTEKGRLVVVILKYDQQTRVTKAFLLGTGAKLRSAVTYETGAQPAFLPDALARSALREELQYWSERAGGR
jgi:hypothetical protein